MTYLWLPYQAVVPRVAYLFFRWGRPDRDDAQDMGGAILGGVNLWSFAELSRLHGHEFIVF